MEIIERLADQEKRIAALETLTQERPKAQQADRDAFERWIAFMTGNFIEESFLSPDEKVHEQVTHAQITENVSVLDFEKTIKYLAEKAKTQQLDFTETVKELGARF